MTASISRLRLPLAPSQRHAPEAAGLGNLEPPPQGPPGEDEALLQVGDIAKAVGKTVRAIHLYEELGLLVPHTRSKGRYRLFGHDALLRVRWIGKLQDLGLSLSEIQGIVRAWEEAPSAPGAMRLMRDTYRTRLAETRAHLARLSALESELASSLHYLETCDTCDPARLLNACMRCDLHGCDEHAPELVVGFHQSGKRPLGPTMAVKLPIYMDYHATTPMDPRVLEEMLPCFTTNFGNAASRSHVFGWKAEEAVDHARERIAKLIGAESDKEIVFTSGATESDNIALKGAAEFYKDKGNHIITTVVEHKAILDTCKRLEKQGFEVTYLPVDKQGLVDVDDVKKAITDRTILVSVMLANNEVGTVQPIGEIGKITRERGVLLHSDAVQGVGKVPFDVRAMNVDLASVTAHKMYGPKGVGCLYVRRSKPRVRVVAQMDGGGHERGMRSGTLNVPGIVGFGKAAEIMSQEGAAESERLIRQRTRLWDRLAASIDEIHLNGHPTRRLPGNLNVAFAYVEGEAMLMAIKDVAVSSGSACTSASLEPSYVLRALGVGEEMAHSSIRFGLGRFTTDEEIDYVADLVIAKVNKLREMSPLYEMFKEGIDLKTIEWAAH